jgi:hypothetical protein
MTFYHSISAIRIMGANARAGTGAGEREIVVSSTGHHPQTRLVAFSFTEDPPGPLAQ